MSTINAPLMGSDTIYSLFIIASLMVSDPIYIGRDCRIGWVFVDVVIRNSILIDQHTNFGTVCHR